MTGRWIKRKVDKESRTGEVYKEIVKQNER